MKTSITLLLFCVYLICLQVQFAVGQSNGWNPWTSWSQCNSNCGLGIQQRSRQCINRALCFGQSTGFQYCRIQCEPPKLIKFGFEITVTQLILSCKGKGLPVPTEEWSFNGIRLGGGDLTINKSSANRGVYKCTLRNQAGIFSVSMKIDF